MTFTWLNIYVEPNAFNISKKWISLYKTRKITIERQWFWTCVNIKEKWDNVLKKIEYSILIGLGYIGNLKKKSESNQEQHHKTLAKLGSCFFTLVYKFDNIAI